MDKCKRCGADIQPGQKMCDNCGMRFAPTGGSDQSIGFKLAAQNVSGQAVAPRPAPRPAEPQAAPPPAPAQAAQPEAEYAPPQAPALSPTAHKTLCAGCMNSFDAWDLADFKGGLYCPDCFAKVSKESSEARGGFSVEVAGGPAEMPKSSTGIKLAVVFGFLVLLGVLGGAGYYVFVVMTKPQEPPPPIVVPGDPSSDGAGELKKDNKELAKDFPPIEVPISKDDRFVKCPVCGRECVIFTGGESECPDCGRGLRTVSPKESPDLKYVAKDGDVAVLKYEDADLRAEKGKEVVKGSGIMVEGFELDGLLLTKTETLKYQDHRQGHEGEKTCEVVVRKKIPKFLEGGPFEKEVMRNQTTVACDGKWKNRVYHKQPVAIPLPSQEPGVYEVPCRDTNCWNRFKVTVKDFPPIQYPICSTTDKIACPQCGLEVFISKGKPDTKACLACDRKIDLYLWKPPDLQFMKKEGNEAVVLYNGKQYNVGVNRELWPQSGVRLVGFGEKGGKTYIKIGAAVEVKLTDYSGPEPVEKTKKVPVEEIIFKKGE